MAKTKKQALSVAYFSMEFALHKDIPNYAGGLGVLASGLLQSCADMGVPCVGISLMYGQCSETKSKFDPKKHFAKLDETVTVSIEGRAVRVGVWKYVLKGRKSSVPIFLLDTNVKGNEQWDKDITRCLYDSEWNTRLCQEAILGIGGVRMLRELGYDDIANYHMNEGHPALLTLELLRELGYDDEAVRRRCVFTTHTPIEAGHDHFGYDHAQRVLGDMLPWHIRKLAGEHDLGMTLLALNLSKKSNAVSLRHRVATRRMFPGHKIEAITNGVHVARWLSPQIAKLYDEKLKGWRDDPSKLSQASKIPADRLAKAHLQGKKRLVKHVNSNPELLSIPPRLQAKDDLFDEKTLTVSFARRFVPYKRPLLVFENIERLRNIGYKRLQLVFAAKCHSDQGFCSEAAMRIQAIARAMRGQIRIAFIPDYDIEINRLLIQGSDIWLNTPEPPNEASGTSGMKAAVNGGINLSVTDGWWIEAHNKHPGSGFSIDGSPDRAKDASKLYDALEQALEAYEGKGSAWQSMMKKSIALGGYFNTHRCIEDYRSKMWRA